MQACRAHKVKFEMLDGRKETVEVEEGDNLLDAMIDAGLEPTHDCKMGVCMTCPARLVRPPAPPSRTSPHPPAHTHAPTTPSHPGRVPRVITATQPRSMMQR